CPIDIQRRLFAIAHDQGIKFRKQFPLLLFPPPPVLSNERMTRSLEFYPSALTLINYRNKIGTDPIKLGFSKSLQLTQSNFFCKVTEKIRDRDGQLCLWLGSDTKRRRGLNTCSIRTR